MGRPGNAAEGQRQRTCRLKQRARALHAEGKSFREIASIMGVGLATAHRYATSTPGQGPPPPPRGAANRRAETHGAHSQVPLGALVETYQARALERWPHLTPDDAAAWALLAARHELAVGAELTSGILRRTAGCAM
jgi:transposase